MIKLFRWHTEGLMRFWTRSHYSKRSKPQRYFHIQSVVACRLHSDHRSLFMSMRLSNITFDWLKIIFATHKCRLLEILHQIKATLNSSARNRVVTTFHLDLVLLAPVDLQQGKVWKCGWGNVKKKQYICWHCPCRNRTEQKYSARRGR